MDLGAGRVNPPGSQLHPLLAMHHWSSYFTSLCFILYVHNIVKSSLIDFSQPPPCEVDKTGSFPSDTWWNQRNEVIGPRLSREFVPSENWQSDRPHCQARALSNLSPALLTEACSSLIAPGGNMSGGILSWASSHVHEDFWDVSKNVSLWYFLFYISTPIITPTKFNSQPLHNPDSTTWSLLQRN